jgi:putative SOS response-associated peptidase YedK
VQVEIEAMKWGMVLPNSTDMVINGRFEELVFKPFYRHLLETKRCVLCFNGYYEWSKDKTPYLITSNELPQLQAEIQGSKVKTDQDVKESQILYAACLYNNAFK